MSFLWLFGVLFCFLLRVQASDYKIVCYYNYWSNYYLKDGAFRVEDIDPKLCTHIVYAYISVSNCFTPHFLDPHLQLPADKRGKDDFGKFVRLNKELNPDVKVLMAIGGFKENDAQFAKLVANTKKHAYFARELWNFLHPYGFDGVSLDWHFPEPSTSTEINPINSPFVHLIKEIKKELEDGKVVAVAGSVNRGRVERAYNIKEVTENADFVSLLTYDYHGPTWSKGTGMVAPLYGTNATDMLNQNSSVHYWLEMGANPKKLLLGMPTYGRTFVLCSKNQTKVGAPTFNKGIAGPYTNVPGKFGYLEILRYASGEDWKTYWDQEVPYRVRGDDWLSFENEESFKRKASYIIKNNLGGAMIQSLDLDDFKNKRYPLITTMHDILMGKVVLPTSKPTTSKPRTTSTETETTEISPPFVCYKEGLFMDFLNCKKYYECSLIETDKSLRLFHRDCSTDIDLYFSELACRCEWKVNADDCLKPENINIQTEGCIPPETF